MKDKIIICVVAEKGGGKGFFVEAVKRMLPEKRVVSVRFSDPLRDILRILNKEETRENFSAMTTAVRGAFNDDGLLNSAMQKLIENSEADIILLDGARKPEEVEFIKSLGGLIVYIDTDQRARYERRKANAEKTDEKDMTWEQFVRQDSLPTEETIRSIGETMADVTLENNSTGEEFEKKIKEFLIEKKLL